MLTILLSVFIAVITAFITTKIIAAYCFKIISDYTDETIDCIKDLIILVKNLNK